MRNKTSYFTRHIFSDILYLIDCCCCCYGNINLYQEILKLLSNTTKSCRVYWQIKQRKWGKTHCQSCLCAGADLHHHGDQPQSDFLRLVVPLLASSAESHIPASPLFNAAVRFEVNLNNCVIASEAHTPPHWTLWGNTRANNRCQYRLESKDTQQMRFIPGDALSGLRCSYPPVVLVNRSFCPAVW